MVILITVNIPLIVIAIITILIVFVPTYNFSHFLPYIDNKTSSTHSTTPQQGKNEKR